MFYPVVGALVLVLLSLTGLIVPPAVQGYQMHRIKATYPDVMPLFWQCIEMATAHVICLPKTAQCIPPHYIPFKPAVIYTSITACKEAIPPAVTLCQDGASGNTKCIEGDLCNEKNFTMHGNNYPNVEACCFENPLSVNCPAILCASVNDVLDKKCFGGNVCFSPDYPVVAGTNYDYVSIDHCCLANPLASGCPVTLCVSSNDASAKQCVGGSRCFDPKYPKPAGPEFTYLTLGMCCHKDPKAAGCPASLCKTLGMPATDAQCLPGLVCSSAEYPLKDESFVGDFETCCKANKGATGCASALCSGFHSKCMDKGECTDGLFPIWVKSYQDYSECCAQNPDACPSKTGEQGDYWFRCANRFTCESKCRPGKSEYSGCLRPHEVTEIYPTPFGDSYDLCELRRVTYPLSDDARYHSNEDRLWLHEVCSSKKIEIQFDYVDIEPNPLDSHNDHCFCDWLTVFDSYFFVLPDKILLDACGLSARPTRIYNTTSNRAWSFFHSDEKNNYFGYAYTYKPIP